MDMKVDVNILEPKAASGLLERLPDTIFRPLAAQNRHLYWDLLLRLYDQFFGPDAPPPPDEGYLARTVILDIERFVSTRVWVDVDDESPAQDNPSGRAHQVLRALLEAGWLQEERIGVRTFLVMHPTVQKFLELLKQFAEEGPQFIGGKVQLIYNQLRAVRANPAEQAAGFHESAKAARALISMLTATNMRVREAMDLLSTHESTADFIRAFFSDYIANLYIRDYHELRTENHPLSYRWEILQIVYDLRDDAAVREALVRWYQGAFKAESREHAEGLFEKDVTRFLLFARIEEHLDRLDASVSRTTRRALSYIHYKIRTRDRLDRLLEQAFTALENANEVGVLLEWPLAAGPLLCDDRLREPKVPPPPLKRSPVRTPRMTPLMRALSALRKIVAKNREVSAAELIAYIEANVPPACGRDSGELPVKDIKDLCIFATLGRLALASAVTPATRHANLPLLNALSKRNIVLSLIRGQLAENEYVIAPKFRIRR